MYLMRMWTSFKGKKIGEDAQGNAYYLERFFFRLPQKRRPRRWVIYNGIPEASKVPPQWHAWLHYNADHPPITNNLRYPWQKEHLPNLTGTKFAYHPSKQKQINNPKPYKAWLPK